MRTAFKHEKGFLENVLEFGRAPIKIKKDILSFPCHVQM